MNKYTECSIFVEGEKEIVRALRKTAFIHHDGFSFHIKNNDHELNINAIDVCYEQEVPHEFTFEFLVQQMPPYDIVKEISNLFQTLEITLDYTNEYYGYSGLVEFYNGEVLDSVYSKSFFELNQNGLVPIMWYKSDDNDCLTINQQYNMLHDIFNKLT